MNINNISKNSFCWYDNQPRVNIWSEWMLDTTKAHKKINLSKLIFQIVFLTFSSVHSGAHVWVNLFINETQVVHNMWQPFALFLRRGFFGAKVLCSLNKHYFGTLIWASVKRLSKMKISQLWWRSLNRRA